MVYLYIKIRGQGQGPNILGLPITCGIGHYITTKPSWYWNTIDLWYWFIILQDLLFQYQYTANNLMVSSRLFTPHISDVTGVIVLTSFVCLSIYLAIPSERTDVQTWILAWKSSGRIFELKRFWGFFANFMETTWFIYLISDYFGSRQIIFGNNIKIAIGTIFCTRSEGRYTQKLTSSTLALKLSVAPPIYPWVTATYI